MSAEHDYREWEDITDKFMRRDYDDVVALLSPLPDEAKLALYLARAVIEKREIATMAEVPWLKWVSADEAQRLMRDV